MCSSYSVQTIGAVTNWLWIRRPGLSTWCGDEALRDHSWIHRRPQSPIIMKSSRLLKDGGSILRQQSHLLFFGRPPSHLPPLVPLSRMKEMNGRKVYVIFFIVCYIVFRSSFICNTTFMYKSIIFTYQRIWPSNCRMGEKAPLPFHPHV